MQDLLPIAATLGALLKARGETIAVAESSAGGLIAASLLAVPGASAYFLGGTVVYTYKARTALMGIPDAAFAGMRPSTEPYALLLARTIRERMEATWGLAETGATGPTGNRYGDAAGHACIAFAGGAPGEDRGESAFTLETGSGDRTANMRAFAAAAMQFLARKLS